MNNRNNKIQNIENQMCNVEDRIFFVFCKNINIANIRVYEKGRLRYICYYIIFILNR